MGTNKPDTQDTPLLGALLDSWDRNNTILVNLGDTRYFKRHKDGTYTAV